MAHTQQQSATRLQGSFFELRYICDSYFACYYITGHFTQLFYLYIYLFTRLKRLSEMWNGVNLLCTHLKCKQLVQTVIREVALKGGSQIFGGFFKISCLLLLEVTNPNLISLILAFIMQDRLLTRTHTWEMKKQNRNYNKPKIEIEISLSSNAVVQLLQQACNYVCVFE